MTDKAQAVLRKMKRRDAREASRLFQDSKARDRILDDFNRDNMPDAKPEGGDQVIAVLKEIGERSWFVKKRDIVV
jgi:hypothetical protein